MIFWEGRLTNNRPTGGRVKFVHGKNGKIALLGGENFFLGSCRVTDERRDFPTGNDGHLAKGPRNDKNFRILTPSKS